MNSGAIGPVHPTAEQEPGWDEPCFDGCSEAECDCSRCQAAELAWEREQGWHERDDDPGHPGDEEDDDGKT